MTFDRDRELDECQDMIDQQPDRVVCMHCGEIYDAELPWCPDCRSLECEELQ